MTTNTKPKIVAVAGPTASGKSRLAVLLASALNGQVISCDSMQIYRGMDIGTGKITKEEARGVAHRLIDIAESSENFSLADYTALARAAIDDVLRAGATPILCGGTGLYLDSLLSGRTLGEAPASPELRSELEARGSDDLYEELRQIDPASAAAVHKNNRKRVIRAIEIWRLTGKTKTEWDAASVCEDPPYRVKRILLLPVDRQALYDRIDRRVADMMARGLEKEARALFASNPSATAAQAIGYKEFLPYFEGRATLEETEKMIAQASRNYAKRQLTWFAAHKNDSLVLDCASSPEEQLAAALPYIQSD